MDFSVFSTKNAGFLQSDGLAAAFIQYSMLFRSRQSIPFDKVRVAMRAGFAYNH